MQTNESAETVKTPVAVLTAKCCQLTYGSRFYALLSPETGSRSCFRNVFHGASTFLAREKERESSRELDQERWLERTKVRESDIYYILYSDKISEANEGARETRRERERETATRPHRAWTVYMEIRSSSDSSTNHVSIVSRA